MVASPAQPGHYLVIPPSSNASTEEERKVGLSESSSGRLC